MKKIFLPALLFASFFASNAFAQSAKKYPAKQYQIPAQQYQKHGEKSSIKKSIAKQNSKPVVAAKAKPEKVEAKQPVQKQEVAKGLKSEVQKTKTEQNIVAQKSDSEPKISLFEQAKLYVKNHAKKPSDKTEGSYVGVDVFGARSSFYVKQSFTDQTTDDTRARNNHIYHGIGLNYKYAFNFNKFFIAPGVFIEKSTSDGTDQRNNDKDNLSFLNIKNRYGVKADFGYDISSNISPYFSIGYAGVDYVTRTYGQDSVSGDKIVSHKNGFSSSVFFGAGVKVNIVDNLFLNFEYNHQDFVASTKLAPNFSDYVQRTSFVSKIDILKVGLAYNF